MQLISRGEDIVTRLFQGHKGKHLMVMQCIQKYAEI
jgi:hypothetical protein